MGTFTYDGNVRVEIDDHQLIHLELVVLAKLRRFERFTFSWERPDSSGGGRSLIWINDSVPLAFDYDSPTMSTIDRRLLTALTDAANSARGLRLLTLGADGEIVEVSPETQIDLTGDRPTASDPTSVGEE